MIEASPFNKDSVRITSVSGFNYFEQLPRKKLPSIIFKKRDDFHDSIIVSDFDHKGFGNFIDVTISVGDILHKNYYKELKEIEAKFRKLVPSPVEKAKLTLDQSHAMYLASISREMTAGDFTYFRKSHNKLKDRKTYPPSNDVLEQLVAKGLLTKLTKKNPEVYHVNAKKTDNVYRISRRGWDVVRDYGDSNLYLRKI